MFDLPKPLINEEAHFVDAFCEIAARHGQTRAQAEASFRPLPLELKQSVAFVGTLSSGWRYLYGAPFHSKGRPIAFGTPQMPPVEHLVKALIVAESTLDPSQLMEYRSRLGDPAKHQDALVEMLPVFSIHRSTRCIYEPLGFGRGNQLIDWLVQPSSSHECLVEVKNRLGILAEEMERLAPRMDRGEHFIPGEPKVSMEALFASTWKKFLPALGSLRLHGIFIFPGLRIKHSDLRSFFNSTLQASVHFVVLTTDCDSAYVEATTPDIAAEVLSTFRLTASNALIY